MIQAAHRGPWARVARVLLHVDEASDVRVSILRSGRVVKTLGSRSLTTAGNVVLTGNAARTVIQVIR